MLKVNKHVGHRTLRPYRPQRTHPVPKQWSLMTPGDSQSIYVGTMSVCVSLVSLLGLGHEIGRVRRRQTTDERTGRRPTQGLKEKTPIVFKASYSEPGCSDVEVTCSGTGTKTELVSLMNAECTTILVARANPIFTWTEPQAFERWYRCEVWEVSKLSQHPCQARVTHCPLGQAKPTSVPLTQVLQCYWIPERGKNVLRTNEPNREQHPGTTVAPVQFQQCIDPSGGPINSEPGMNRGLTDNKSAPIPMTAAQIIAIQKLIFAGSRDAENEKYWIYILQILVHFVKMRCQYAPECILEALLTVGGQRERPNFFMRYPKAGSEIMFTIPSSDRASVGLHSSHAIQTLPSIYGQIYTMSRHSLGACVLHNNMTQQTTSLF
ncbi:hypothetical protein CBL_11029 [Carabus blaptoides fortunei]